MKIYYKSLIAVAISITFFVSPLFSQNTVYQGISLPQQLNGSHKHCKDYTTYDLAMVPLLKSSTEAVDYEKLPYEIKLANTKKVATDGEYHVIAVLRGMIAKLTSKSTANVNVKLGVTLFDKFGKKLDETTLNRDAFFISLGRTFNNDEIKDESLISRVIIQNAIDTALAGFNNSLIPGTMDPEFNYATLKDVKDKPELKEFHKQIEDLKEVLFKNPNAVKTTLDGFLPYWEKMSNYAGEGDVNEVKRAAYQNLINYYLYSKNTTKAKEYLDLYKPIDKVESAAWGLVKQKNSDICEKWINRFSNYVDGQNYSPATDARIVTQSEMINEVSYYIFEKSTITLKGKKNAGVYNGRLKILKLINIEAESGVLDLDKKTTSIAVIGKNEKGEDVSFSALLSEIASVKTETGDLLIQRNIGASFGMGGTSTLLKSSYKSDKIVVYRAEFPKSDNYLIVKNGDDDGYMDSILKGRKKMIKYFSDCAELYEKLKNGTVSESEAIEKIAEMYTNCK